MKTLASIPHFKSPNSVYRNVRIYTRGFNAQGQLGLGNKLLSSQIFQEVKSLSGLEQRGLGITHLAVDHCQNVAVLNDSQVLHWGWPPCPLTTYRTIWIAHFYPRFFPFLWHAIDSPQHDFYFEDLFQQKGEEQEEEVVQKVEKL